ncbi:MAG: hypothetical protein NXI30_14660 [bacterium]|nr:hypothetical protein [bacterium]
MSVVGFGSARRSGWRLARRRITELTLLCLTAGGFLGCDAPGPDGAAPLELDAEQMRVEVGKMLRITDTLDRHRRMVQLMDSIDESNLQGAADAYVENVGRVDPHEARLFANRWSKIDPQAAVSGILAWPYPRSKNQAILEAVFQWAINGGGEEARAFVDPRYEGSAGTLRSPTKFMYLAVLQGLGVAKDWDQLTDMLVDAEEDGDRELWITEVMIEINRVHGLDTTREWLDSIPWDAGGNLKISTMKRGLLFVAGQDYDRAAQWYEKIEAENPEKAIEAMPQAVQARGASKPRDAIGWLRERPETGVRDALIREIMVGWLARDADREAGEAWIRANLGDPIIQRLGVVPLANHLLESLRFVEAADLVREHAMEPHRSRVLATAFVRWGQVDPGAVDAYIEEHGVSEEIASNYRTRLAQKAVRVKRRGRENVVPSVPTSPGQGAQEGPQG